MKLTSNMQIPPDCFLVIDCFGTLLERPKKNSYTLFTPHVTVSEKEFMRHIKTNANPLSCLPKGWIHDEVEFNFIKSTLAERIHDDISCCTPLSYTKELLAYANKNYCIFSNISPGFHQALTILPSYNVELSFNTGCIKPSENVFTYLTQKYNLKQYRKVVLIDDKPSNTAAATAFGWEAIIANKDFSITTLNNLLTK